MPIPFRSTQHALSGSEEEPLLPDDDYGYKAICVINNSSDAFSCGGVGLGGKILGPGGDTFWFQPRAGDTIFTSQIRVKGVAAQVIDTILWP